MAPAASAGGPPHPVLQVEEAVPSAEGPAFEMSTAMLVMPFLAFKEQTRIFKSIKAWRDDALASGLLVQFAWIEGGTGKVVNGALDGTIVFTRDKVAIFISHTWWDRAHPCLPASERAAHL